MSNKFYCGIDISKKKFDSVLLIDNKSFHRVFENTVIGIQNFEDWLLSKTPENSLVHVCMEATNKYHELIAFSLSEKDNFIVSVINPRKANKFAQMMEESKTDKIDAKLLALYCEKHKPEKFIPPSRELRELKELTRLMDNLIELRTIQKVRLQTFNTETAAHGVLSTIKSIEDTIAETQKKINNCIDSSIELKNNYRLLNSIPGYGNRVSSVLLSEIKKDENGNFHPKKMTKYFGLNVKKFDSGDSVHKKQRIMKYGSPRVRSLLYMSALVSIVHNPVMKEFYERLVNKGKPKKVVLVAIMRKLLVLACTILNSNKPYDAEYAVEHAYKPKTKISGNVIYCNKFGQAS